MKRTYQDVARQIERLKIQAEQARRRELQSVIDRMRIAIEHYGITADDLFADRKPAKKAPGRLNGVRYRDDRGNIAYGRGPQPKWLRDAIAAGKRLEDFEV